MPLCFFHLRTGEHLDKDAAGVDDPGLEASGDLVWAAVPVRQPVRGDAFEINDQDGRTLLTVLRRTGRPHVRRLTVCRKPAG